MLFQLKREYDYQLRLHFTNIYLLLSQGNNASLINFSYASTKATQYFFFQGKSPQTAAMFSVNCSETRAGSSLRNLQDIVTPV